MVFLTFTPVLDQSFHVLTDFLWYKLVGCLEHFNDVDIGGRNYPQRFEQHSISVTYVGIF
jgi:hypothetical protein